MAKAKQFVVCVDNSGYKASLEPRKLYQVVPDPAAEKHGQVRVVDESGEDYLYPASFFLSVPLPTKIAAKVAKAA
jgi:hypothetical protein